MMDKKLNAVILARVSSKSQEDEGYSLDSQLKLLASYCDHKDFIVRKVFKITETASKEQSRKVFHELLSYIQANNIYHLAVEKTDRLTRNFRDAVAIDDWLERDESRMLHAVKENLQLHKGSKSDVKFMWNIHLAVAKKYTDNLREEAMKGWAEKLAQGWLPAPPPPGYMTTIVNGKRIHVPNPETRTAIIKIFSMYLEPNQSIKTIAQEMADLGLRTKQGKPHSKSHVQRILNNPFYIGINRHNGKEYPGAQEQIIGKELFHKVQQKMHRGRPTIYRRHNPVLKNIIKCSDCGGVVTWQKQKEKYYGACQRKTDGCKGKKFLREDQVEEIIMSKLQKLVSPSEKVIDWVSAAIRSEERENIELRERTLATLRSSVDRLKRMDAGLYEDKLSGEITKELYAQKHDTFVSQVKETNERLQKLDYASQQSLEKRLVILELSQKAARIYELKTPEQKRLIITKLFKNITAHNGIISVNYTNFCKAVADRVQLTTNLLGGK